MMTVYMYIPSLQIYDAFNLNTAVLTSNLTKKHNAITLCMVIHFCLLIFDDKQITSKEDSVLIRQPFGSG